MTGKLRGVHEWLNCPWRNAPRARRVGPCNTLWIKQFVEFLRINLFYKNNIHELISQHICHSGQCTFSSRCFQVRRPSLKNSGGRFRIQVVAQCFASSMSLKWVPLRISLSFGKRKKSDGAKSGLYGGWGSTSHRNSRRTSCATLEECAGALSWWNRTPPWSFPFRFLIKASFSFLKTSA